MASGMPTTTGHYFITMAYDLGGITIKSTRLNVQLVKAVATPTMASASMVHGTAAGSFDSDFHNDGQFNAQ